MQIYGRLQLLLSFLYYNNGLLIFLPCLRTTGDNLVSSQTINDHTIYLRKKQQ